MKRSDLITRLLLATSLLWCAVSIGPVFGDEHTPTSPTVLPVAYGFSIRFDANHPYVQRTPLLQKEWTKVEIHHVEPSRIDLSGVIAGTNGKPENVRMPVPIGVFLPTDLDALRTTYYGEAKSSPTISTPPVVAKTDPSDPSPATTEKPDGFVLLPKPVVQSGLYYQNLKLPEGPRMKTAVTGYADNLLTLKGTDSSDKPLEIRTHSSWDIPARVAVESRFLFYEVNPMNRILICSEPTALRRWEAPASDKTTRFQRLAKEASTGPIFAEVPEGYVIFHMAFYNGNHLCGVELTADQGGKNFAIVDGRTFLSLAGDDWWNQISGTRNKIRLEKVDFQPVATDPRMVLFSLANPGKAILRNTAEAMRQVWVDQNPANQNLALVETEAGWMAGTMKLLPAQSETAKTWSEVMASQDEPVTLQLAKSRKIKPGASIMEFREHHKQLNQRGMDTMLDAFQVSTGDLQQIRTNGLEPIFARMSAPEAVAFRLVANASATSITENRDREKLQVYLTEVTPETLGFRIREKVIYREVTIQSSGATETIDFGKPRSREDEANVHLPLDSDGAVRLTNGEAIFEIKPDQSEIILNEYKIAGTPR
ncbi:MAG: hypothetical protein ACOVMP_03320 [Chthoniobacterales bacterium]